MMDSLSTLLTSIPAGFKGLAALVGAAGIGAAAQGFALQGEIRATITETTENRERIVRVERSQREIMARLDQLQRDVQITNCLALTERTGEDWRGCLETGP